MTSYLDELESRLQRPGESVKAADLIAALRPIAQALEEIGRHRETIKDTVVTVNGNRDFIDALQARLLIVDDLPAEAPFGALIRRRTGTVGQQATLYLGNGPGQPLSKLTPSPL